MFLYPHYYTPPPSARAAAEKVMAQVRDYMSSHPESELHKRGKMFGVLVVRKPDASEIGDEMYLSAFSGVLDGSYHHDGYVEPIYEVVSSEIVGKDREDSQAKQRWLFEQYRLRNAQGEVKNLMDIWQEGSDGYEYNKAGLPPSGTGECCAPKLLQAAYLRGLQPVAMAEFWMGASPKDEIRVEGQFYPACIAKCRPILRHMLTGIDVEENPLVAQGRLLAKDVKILYEDEDMMAVSKPSGLLTVPGREEQYSLEEELRSRKSSQEKSGSSSATLKAVHRLDMDTSGIVLVAKTEQAYTELQRQFASHAIHKIYRARVGDARDTTCTCAMSEEGGTICLPLLPNPLDRPRQIVDWQHGKRAVTRWKRLHDNLIELYPETGRTHQLRVHCAHPDGLGTPIAGDRLYGNGKGRLMLHACQITFTHPTTGKQITIDDLHPLFQ